MIDAPKFAIGTWVVAEVLALLVALDHGVGGGTGVSLTGLHVHAPADRQAYTYWMTLGFGALLLGLVFALLRSPAGAALQAIRDDEQAAASLGVRVDTGKLLLFVLAAFGCGAIGLGATAVGFALVVPRGAWGWALQRRHIQLFPVGYRLAEVHAEVQGDAAGDR